MEKIDAGGQNESVSVPAALFTASGTGFHRKLEFTGTAATALPAGRHLPDFSRFYDASLDEPQVLVGVCSFDSGFVFCALTMRRSDVRQGYGRGSSAVVRESRESCWELKSPTMHEPVAISTKAAQREMIIPSLLVWLYRWSQPGARRERRHGLLVGGLSTGFLAWRSSWQRRRRVG